MIAHGTSFNVMHSGQKKNQAYRTDLSDVMEPAVVKLTLMCIQTHGLIKNKLQTIFQMFLWCSVNLTLIRRLNAKKIITS